MRGVERDLSTHYEQFPKPVRSVKVKVRADVNGWLFGIILVLVLVNCDVLIFTVLLVLTFERDVQIASCPRWFLVN